MKKIIEKKVRSKGATLSERLRIAQTAHRISIYKLDAMTTANSTMIRRYLSGKSIPGLERTDELAVALGVSFSWLAKGEGPMLPMFSENSELFSTENLENIWADLFTVCKIVEKIEEAHRNQRIKLSPKQISKSVALLCMNLLQPSQYTDDEEVLRFVEEMKNRLFPQR